MFNTIVGMMSFSGSIVVILYMVAYPVLKSYSIKGQTFILKMAVFFYLVPVSELKCYLWDIIDRSSFLSRYVGSYMKQERPIIEKFNIIMKFDDGAVRLSNDLKLLFFLLLCISLISLGLLIRKGIKYKRLKDIFLEDSKDLPEGEWEQQYLHLKAELNVHKNIKIRCSEYCPGPLVIGFLSPIIILPAQGIDMDSWKYIIKHELSHVKHKDLTIRLLAVVVIVFHWFNPLVYFLFYELIQLSEMTCDREVLAGSSDSDRKKYSKLIIELATVHAEEVAINLADKFSIKRRILEMKRVRKRNILLSSTIALAIGLATSVMALANYTPSRVITQDGNYNPDTTLQVANTDDYYETETEALPYDYFFIREDGTIVPLSKNPSRILCAHTKTETGGLSIHEKNNKTGGCTVSVYDVVKCYKCDAILEKTLKSTHTYTVCPH